jgi:hypothetical protein
MEQPLKCTCATVFFPLVQQLGPSHPSFASFASQTHILTILTSANGANLPPTYLHCKLLLTCILNLTTSAVSKLSLLAVKHDIGLVVECPCHRSCYSCLIGRFASIDTVEICSSELVFAVGISFSTLNSLCLQLFRLAVTFTAFTLTAAWADFSCHSRDG